MNWMNDVDIQPRQPVSYRYCLHSCILSLKYLTINLMSIILNQKFFARNFFPSKTTGSNCCKHFMQLHSYSHVWNSSCSWLRNWTWLSMALCVLSQAEFNCIHQLSLHLTSFPICFQMVSFWLTTHTYVTYIIPMTVKASYVGQRKEKNNLATKVRFSTYYEYKIDQKSVVIIFCAFPVSCKLWLDYCVEHFPWNQDRNYRDPPIITELWTCIVHMLVATLRKNAGSLYWQRIGLLRGPST